MSTTCIIDDCDREGRGNHLCSSHNATAWRYQLSATDLRFLLAGDCMVVGCESPATSIDHDHGCCSSGVLQLQVCGRCVRGALCRQCNQWVGVVERRGPGWNIPARIRRGIELYLAA